MLCPSGGGLFHFRHSNPRVSGPREGGTGQPLFLTPYIEAGNVIEGKSNQKPPGVLPVVVVFLSNYPPGSKICSDIFYSLLLVHILTIGCHILSEL